MRFGFRPFSLSIVGAAFVLGCAPGALDGPRNTSDAFDQFAEVAGSASERGDTGYVGGEATEVEGTLRSRLVLPLPQLTQDERVAFAHTLTASPASDELRLVSRAITDQMKFARNQLRGYALDLNVERDDATIESTEVVPGGVAVQYSVSIDSVIRHVLLNELQTTATDIIREPIKLSLPLTTQWLFERVGLRCASDPEGGSEAITNNDVRAETLFFYWDTKEPGCPIETNELSEATLSLRIAPAAGTVYPEYDRLAADRVIEVGMVFGQINHGELLPSDWGFITYEDMHYAFQAHLFRVTETFPNRQGERVERVYPNGLKVRITMHTPVMFAESIPRELFNERMRNVLGTSEIFYYGGHSDYGTHNAFDTRHTYPRNQYQIVFMDSCWSYQYYTKQIFRNRATTEDPTGFASTDVVNNAEPGFTGGVPTASVLMIELFRATDEVRGGNDVRDFSWQNLIGFMNAHALTRAPDRGTGAQPEVYGVSGARTNAFQPAAIAAH